MDRWTKKQLEEMNDLDFAICILTERRNKVSPYSPLGLKLDQTRHTLNTMRREAIGMSLLPVKEKSEK